MTCPSKRLHNVGNFYIFIMWEGVRKIIFKRRNTGRNPLIDIWHLEIVQQLELQWREIKEEFERIPDNFYVPWVLPEDYTGNWRLVPIIDERQFPSVTVPAVPKDMLQRNCAMIPKTISILNQFSNIVSAAFSILYPGTFLIPHKDTEYSDGKLSRIHLALDIPENSAIEFFIENTQQWQKICWTEGKCFEFDGSYMHKAYNYGQKPRVVLIIDIK